ncbi:MAG: 50S ribosomal protein L7/L12 [Candidatus Babeliales bacterium]
MADKSFDQIIDQISNLTVIELADLVKELEKKFGVVAGAMPVAAAPSSSGADVKAEASEEKSNYSVTLAGVNESSKINIIKALRKVVPGMGLSEAKEAFENTPKLLLPSVSKNEADEAKKILEEAGAKVTLG